MSPTQTLPYLPCPKLGCHRWFKNKSGLTQHLNARHSTLLAPQAHKQACGQDERQEHEWVEEHEPEQEAEQASQFNNEDTPPTEPQVCAKFFSEGDKYYQNFHPKLTGAYCVV